MSTRDQEEGASGPDLGALEKAELQAMKRAFEPIDPALAETMKSFDCGGSIPKCREEVEALWLVADGGCHIKLRERLEAHFEHCTSCGAQYEVEVRIKEILAKKCQAGPCAPESLKDKLRVEIRGMLNVSHPRVETGRAETGSETRPDQNG